MSPVRKTIVFVLAIVMIAGGGWLLYEQVTNYEQFTTSTIIYGLLGGGASVFVGLALLWEDFIAPLIARKPS